MEQLESRQLLAGDLVAHWVADDLSGGVEPPTAWTDRIRGISADVTGQPQIVGDQLGGRHVVRFDPSDGHDRFDIESGDNPLTRAGDFSVVVAFRTDSQALAGTDGHWFTNTGLVDANTSGFGNDWGLTLNAEGRLSTGLGSGLGSLPKTIYSTEGGYNDGQLQIAVVTRSATRLDLYANGMLVASDENVGAALRSNLDMTFGNVTQGTLPYTGDLAQVRLYDGALSFEEVASIQTELQDYYSNSPPLAVDDAYTLPEDAFFFSIPVDRGLLANDTDADGDALSVVLVDEPAHGDLLLRDDGSFAFNPDNNYFGTDTFTYYANDFRNSNLATVTLTIEPTYDAPVGEADFYRMQPGNTLFVPSLVGVLTNDDNPDKATLTTVLDQTVSDGVLSFRSDGSFDYEPEDFAGLATFTYRIDDGTSLSDPVEVSIIVNTSPTANDDALTVTEDTPLDLLGPEGVLQNDQDAEGIAGLSITIIEPPTHGTIQTDGEGRIIYVPELNYVGEDSFRYRATDGFATSLTATAQISILPVNDVPLGTADYYFTQPNRVLNVPPVAGVLINDVDVEEDLMSATIESPPSDGTVTLAADGSFRYTPQAGFTGTDSFTYRAFDVEGASAPTAVTIYVADQPIAITEVMALNDAILPTRTRVSETNRYSGLDQYYDWIEIKNQLDVPLDLAGLHLTDDSDQPTRWQFPAGSTLEPNGYLVLYASGLDVKDPLLDENGLLHTNFRLGSSGESLYLTDYVGQPLDETFVDFPAQRVNVSYGITPEGLRFLPIPTPGELNGEGRLGFAAPVEFSSDAGFFDAPLEVTLSTPEPAATIRYTLDGTIPTATNGIEYTQAITINSTTTLRAAALVDGYLPSRTETKTYLFLEDVIRQSPNGETPAGWPTGPVKGQALEYGMDPDIVDSAQWGPDILAAFQQIPSISIVTDQENLTDPDSGIYVNPGRDGRPWERPTSVELITPDGSTGFQTDAGLRIRGGFSRGTFNPKHSFRLFFRDEYEGRLAFPLFEDEGANEFAAVDLRTAQNYAWSNDTFNDETRNSFLRDVFSRDLQGAQGQPYTRSRYYHLYLNGQYWGLYQTEERPEATFASTYLGKDEDDYDVIKASGGTLEATDGTLDDWTRLWELSRNEITSLEQYFLIQGKNPDGTDNLDLPVYMRMDILVDFMINVVFTGNEDMPTSLGSGASPNNFWAIRDAESRDGWWLVAHDNEHNMLRVDYDQTRDDTAGRTAATFNPKYLHQQLDEFEEYQVAFGDRVQELFFNDGPLTVENTKAQMQTRIDQIDMAIIAESARWGDHHRAYRDNPLNKATWLAEVDWLMNTFLEQRRDVVLGQLQRKGLFPNTDAPTLNQDGGVVEAGFQVLLSAPTGTIYYTLDGSDPREIGGPVNPAAQAFTAGSNVTLEQDTLVKARVWTGSEWSPLTQAEFLVGAGVSPTTLRISEIHYNPASPSTAEQAAGFDDKDDFEFIELVNIGAAPLDLSSAAFTQVDVEGDVQGVNFNFSEGRITRLQPGERVLVVEDLEAFEMRYGTQLPVAGQWSGGLGNSSELITLRVDGALLQQFRYDEQWHPTTDGGGFSLEVIDTSNPDLATWGTAAAWRPSTAQGGSPGAANAQTLIGDSNGDGVFNSSDLVLVFQAGEYEDGIPQNSTFAEGDWNGDGDFTTSDLVLAFQSGNYVAASQPLRRRIQAVDSLFEDSQWLNFAAHHSDDDLPHEMDDPRLGKLRLLIP